MEHKGTVYFFTGLSGAGKTTVGSLFYRRLKTPSPTRSIWTVTRSGWPSVRMWATPTTSASDGRGGSSGCVSSSPTKASTWCAAPSPCIRASRAWNRANIPNYKEIYLRVKPETLLARNQKGLYTGGHNVVGVDLPFDEPQTPDLIIQNDGERTPLEAVEEIERVLYPNIVENPIDNRDYWNRYYQDGLCPMDPSPFARYAATLVEPGRTLVDLGCGNGRDALYFASLGLSVIAIDLSDTAIQTLRERGGDNPRFLCGDFINAPIHRPASYDYAYSRFTIHAINQQQERMLLLAMHRAIKPGGKFFIEVRGVHDPLYGRGQPQEKNAFFYNNHYRRFIVMEELTASLQEVGFRVEYAQERTGFAPYGNDDPPVIRIVAIRKEMKA